MCFSYYNHLLESFWHKDFIMSQANSKKFRAQGQTNTATKRNQQYLKNFCKIRITKEFLSDVLNQAKMRQIRSYLKQNQQKYKDKVSKHNQFYSLYEDYLLINILKDCQKKIYANNMFFQLSQIKIKNSQRTLASYHYRLNALINNLQKAQTRQQRGKRRNSSQIKDKLIKNLNLLLDNENLQILTKHVAQHQKQLQNKIQIYLNQKKKRYTLLQDCIILKEFKQKIKQNKSLKPIYQFLSKILNRRKRNIFQRLLRLFNVNKDQLAFCIQNNFRIQIKPRKSVNSKSIIQNMKIFVNQWILKYLKQQLQQKKKKKSSQINIRFIQNLIILMYVKKYSGFITLKQIIQIISQKIFLKSKTVYKKFYKIISKLRNNQKCSQEIQNGFRQIQAKFQHQQNQEQEISKVNSKQKIIQTNGKKSNISKESISEMDTFINKLRQSNFKQNNDSIIDILREIEESVKNENSYFADQNAHEDLFFSDEQEKQDHKNHHNKSLALQKKSLKKQKKIQKKKKIKTKKQSEIKIKIKKQFVENVLNQTGMKTIEAYLQQHKSEYEDKFFMQNSHYSRYQDFLLLKIVKECLAKDMQIQLDELLIENNQRTQTSVYYHLLFLLNKLKKVPSENYSKIMPKGITTIQLRAFLDQLLDNDTLKTLQSYIDSYLEQFQKYEQNQFNSGYNCKPHTHFTLFQDCMILKTIKQRINQNQHQFPIFQNLPHILKRIQLNIHDIYQRLILLKTSLTKENLLFSIQKDLNISFLNCQSINQSQILEKNKIQVNQIIQLYLNQQLQKYDGPYKGKSKLKFANPKWSKNLIILMEIKKYAGITNLNQIFQIVAQTMDMAKSAIQRYFYGMIQKLKKNSQYQKISQQSFNMSHIKSQNLHNEKDQISNQSSILMSQNYSILDNNNSISSLYSQTESEVETFINKLNQSRFQQDEGSFIRILREIQSAVKNDKSYQMNKTFSQNLLFSDQELMCKTNHDSSVLEEKNSKKQKKMQKKKTKSKMTRLTESNLTLTESLNLSHNLQYIRKKWHLNPKVDERTVYQNSLQIKQKDK